MGGMDPGDKTNRDAREPFEVRFTRHTFHTIEPRPLSAWERDTIERILANSFHGRGAAIRQLKTVCVETECSHCPTIWLQVQDPQDRVARNGQPWQGIAPCELHGFDIDGMPYQILLHIDEGVITELDAFRGDGGRFLALPDPAVAALVCG